MVGGRYDDPMIRSLITYLTASLPILSWRRSTSPLHLRHFRVTELTLEVIELIDQLDRGTVAAEISEVRKRSIQKDFEMDASC